MILATFTIFHVLLSLVGIAAGFAVMIGMLNGQFSDFWNKLFLSTTAATSLTGYLFPVHHLMPSHIVGLVSLVVLAIAIPALYVRRLEGGWRKAYVITAMLAQYLNVFVLIAQLFMKVPVLKAAAPTGSEPPFLITQVLVLTLFVIFTTLAAIKFNSRQFRTA